MFLKGITVILLLGVCFLITDGAYGLNVTDCGTADNVTIHEITVSLCKEEDVCPLIRGNTTNLNIKFEVGAAVKNVTAFVYGTIDDSPLFLPFPIKDKYACKGHSGLECPLVPGKIHTYKADIEIKEVFPKIRSVVKWKLCEKKENIICILIPSRIIDA